MAPQIDFITVTHRTTHLPALERSLQYALGDLAMWSLNVVDGTTHDLFTGYNRGAADTRGELLAFVHDDVQLLGNPLTMTEPLRRLDDARTGFIGVAGTTTLDKHAMWWGQDQDEQTLSAGRGMAAHAGDAPFGMTVAVWPAGRGEFGQVAVLDGVLLMCHRRTFESLSGFDAANYKGFHFYDIDITFRASMARLGNYAAPIPLLHASDGAMSEGWHANRRIFLRKFGHLLPARV